MTATQSSCGLMLVVEAGAGVQAVLQAALGAGAVAAVCVVPATENGDAAPTLAPLIGIIQKAGAAALIVDDAALARRLKADGVHLTAGRAAGDYDPARETLGRGSIVGADAGRSRDAAMHLGEAGADYIGFGAPDFVADRQAARARRLELVQWWAEIFEVPCVAFDVETREEAEALAQAGADFVAVRLPRSMAPAQAKDIVLAVMAAIASEDA